VTHGASVDADQVQSRDVATVSVPVPPLAGSSAVLLVTEISHFSPDGPVTLVVVEPHATAAPALASHAARKTIRPTTRRARIFDPEGEMEIKPAHVPPGRDVRCNLRSSTQRASPQQRRG